MAKKSSSSESSSGISRRRFLGQASCAAVTGIPVLNTLLNLRLFSSVASAALPVAGEYRALVCIFKSGGNDSFNMLTPFSGASETHANSYTEYANSRSDLALETADLHEIHPLNTPGRTFGVHPSMPNLANLFETSKAAFVANVGTLIERVDHFDQVHGNSKRLPLGLYSHSDQIEQWQTSVPHSRSGVGWAGRMADLIREINPNQTVSMNISLDGSNVWQTGILGAEYAVNAGNSNESGGAVGLRGYTSGDATGSSGRYTNATSAAVDSQIGLQYANLLQQTWQDKRRNARDAYDLYNSATTGPNDIPVALRVTFPNTPLGRQLRQIARAINGRTHLQAVRQTFFANRGGWDHHSNTLAQQEEMLAEVDEALGAFWQQLLNLGLQDKVTIFSASDFGRTLTSNSQGSDHAWGSNQYVIGGSVVGKKIYGTYPSLALNDDVPDINPLDTGRGRLIPTTSCDEFFAEMALWLGVPQSSLPLVLPNIGNFYAQGSSTPPLGFLGPF